jgi:glycosyltransferase involved in cell wall biosynthesis
MDLCQTTPLAQADAFSRRGFGVTFLAPKTESGVELVQSRGHQIIEIRVSKWPGLFGISFERGVRRRLPEVLNGDNPPDLILAEWRGFLGAVAAAGDIPIVMDDRSPPVPAGILGRAQWLQYDRAWRRALTTATAISVISVELGRLVRDRFGVSDTNLFIITPSGVDVDRFAENKADNDPAFVYHGRLDARRGIQHIVHFGDLLAERGETFSMRFFGSGDLYSKLESDSSTRPWLEIIGQQPLGRVPELLADRNIGLLPLPDIPVWRVSSPLKLFEYAAAGMAVIATDIPAHRNVIGEGWLHLVPPSDSTSPQAFLTAFDELQKIDRATTSTAARRTAEQHFTWDKSTSDLIQACIRIVEVGING